MPSAGVARPSMNMKLAVDAGVQGEKGAFHGFVGRRGETVPKGQGMKRTATGIAIQDENAASISHAGSAKFTGRIDVFFMDRLTITPAEAANRTTSTRPEKREKTGKKSIDQHDFLGGNQCAESTAAPGTALDGAGENPPEHEIGADLEPIEKEIRAVAREGLGACSHSMSGSMSGI